MSKKQRIAIIGGSFNPPHLWHVAMVMAVLHSGLFDRIIVIPCGYRDGEKESLRYVDSLSRATMCRMAFGDIPGVEVDTFDLEGDSFTRAIDLEARFASEGEVWHVLGADAFVPRNDSGKPGILTWYEGRKLFDSSRFYIFIRPGYEIDPECLPPHHKLSTMDGIELSSTEVRARIHRGESVDNLLSPRVAAYIQRYRLYLPGTAPVPAPFLGPLVPMVFPDPYNREAIKWAKRIEAEFKGQIPNCIVVLGGDGTMVHAIREHWSKCLPFLGINFGHVGHFMNRFTGDPIEMLRSQVWLTRQFPLLDVKWEDVDGKSHRDVAVNDVWIERDTRPGGRVQSAKLKLSIDGRVCFPSICGDGILVASPQGSTGYANNLRATPIFTADLVVVAGIALARSHHYVPSHEKSDALIEVEALELERRPVHICVDFLCLGFVRSMMVSSSCVAGFQVFFTREDDLDEKRFRFQYPLQGS